MQLKYATLIDAYCLVGNEQSNTRTKVGKPIDIFGYVLIGSIGRVKSHLKRTIQYFPGAALSFSYNAVRKDRRQEDNKNLERDGKMETLVYLDFF